MGFIASDSGNKESNFKRVPPGSHMARCYALIDLGTQHSDGQYGPKEQHKIHIGWELFGEDEDGNALVVDVDGKQMPMTIKKSYTVSLHEKSALRKDLANWRGKDFTEEEAKGFDVSKLIGQPCMLSVTTSERDSKTYSNVAGISRLPAALKDKMPAAVHKPVVFNLDAPNMEVFNAFHDKLKDAIMASPEWQSRGGSTQSNEDVPF